jgi:fumarate reductase subunit C
MSDDTKTKEYIRPMPANWWMMKKTFVLFIVRELTCVFVGGYALFLLVLVARRDQPEAFAAWLNSPLLIVLQIIALPMLLYHSITWINLTPKVMVVWRGEERVSPLLIAGANYVAWAIISIVILSISCP